jgi:hypothetical protein
VLRAGNRLALGVGRGLDELAVSGLSVRSLHDDDGLALGLDAAEAAPAEDAEKEAEDEADVPLAALQNNQ